MSKLADVATGNALLSGGVGTAPAYGKVGLTTHVSGILPAASGGTGQSSYIIGDLTYASSATTLAKLADVATGNALLSGGVGVAPVYGKVGLTTHVDGILPAANGGTGSAALDNVLLSAGVGVASTYGKVGLATHVSGTLPAANGGTGQSSYVIGDIAYASGVTTLSKLADVATGNALLSGGVGVAPAYGKVGLTTHVDGTLPAANGGTGQSSYAIGDIIYASSATALSKLADVATGNALLSGGTGTAPAYGKVGLTTHVSGILPAANGGTGQSSYAIGDIAYASGATTLSKLADVDTGNALLSGGVGVAPAYGKVGLTTHISGILGVGNGGTGATGASTGSGGVVLSVSPSLTTPILGTPAVGSILTNCTGLPISTGVSGLGTGVATFLANPLSANLKAAVTDETGSGGALVFAISPTLVTPIIGAATGTSLAATGAITSSGTAGIGYVTGAGGTVTQLTDKETAVVLNKTCGQILMSSAALTHDTAVSFTLANSTIADDDVLILNHFSGGTVGSYLLNAQCVDGSAIITVRNVNSSGTLSEAITIAFVVIKAVVS